MSAPCAPIPRRILKSTRRTINSIFACVSSFQRETAGPFPTGKVPLYCFVHATARYSVRFLQLVYLPGDEAASLVGAAAVAAVHVHQLSAFRFHGYHAALIQYPAVAADDLFFFHQASSTTQKPIGARVSQLGATVCILWASRIFPAGICVTAYSSTRLPRFTGDTAWGAL